MKSEKIKYFLNETLKYAPSFRKTFLTMPDCENHKLSPHQLYCLRIISDSGTISMGKLAQKLGVSNQQVTRVMDSLSEESLVERFTDTENRRLVQAKVSQKGQQALEDIEELMNANIASFLETLTEDELDKLIYHMQGMKEIISKAKTLAANADHADSKEHRH